jgi:hypothetical protein
MKRLSPDEYILGALSLYLVRNCLCFFYILLVANTLHCIGFHQPVLIHPPRNYQLSLCPGRITDDVLFRRY